MGSVPEQNMIQKDTHEELLAQCHVLEEEKHVFEDKYEHLQGQLHVANAQVQEH